MKNLIAALALLLFAGAASADTIWDYQGTPMSGCNCALTGSVTLSGGQITTWDFTDGLVSLNTNDSFMEQFSEQNDFTLWKLLIVDHIDNPTLGFFSQFYGSQFESSDASPSGHEQGDRGLWSDPVSTPEPSTLVLLGIGLASLALRRKRVKASYVWEPLA